MNMELRRKPVVQLLDTVDHPDNQECKLNLYELQNRLEAEQVDVGISRYTDIVKTAKKIGIENTTKYGRSLMSYSVSEVSDGLKGFLKEAFDGRAGRLNASATMLSMIDAEKASYLALKFAVDGVSTRQKLTKVAMKIGMAIQDEVKFRIFEDTNKAWFQKIRNEVCKRTADRHYRRYAIIHTMNKKAVVDFQPWSQQERLHVGSKMIDLIVQATGLFEVQTIRVGKNRQNIYLVPTDKTVEWITKFNERGELLFPAFMPMVVPPKDWTGIYSGGYLNELASPLPIVKTHNKAYLEEIAHEDMPLVYQTQNVCQKTAWRVNERVLHVMEGLAVTGHAWGDIPAMAGSDVPVCPLDSNLKKDDMTEEQKQIFTDWKRQASKVHQMNAKNKSKRIQFLRSINMAKKFAELGTPLYFVYQRDFRGRIYIVNPFLNFQGPSYSKALLEFANAKPIETEEHLHCMMRHGANVWGFDKASFSERVQFIKDREEEIKAYAADPLEHTGWTDADSPFEFLAFCFEYAEFLEVGYGYQSRLIVCVDGSNNGLQHLSAILRDEIGAAATNLIPNERPADVYKDVIELAMSRVAEDDDPMSKMWVEWGADRKCSKRPVMTRSYGSTQFSCREYIYDYIIDRVAKGDEAPWGEEHFAASVHLTSFLWEAMDEVIIAAKEVMDWIQGIARLYGNADLPMTWRCPNGFMVNQMYPEVSARRITTYIDDSLIKPVVHEPKWSSVDSRRMANGAAPNVVHSLDASALDLTVEYILREQGEIDLAFVHDSYGCHAADMPVMEKCLRQAFIAQYKDFNILRYLYDEAKGLFGDDVKEPPKMGDLDIDMVMKSKYFFA